METKQLSSIPETMLITLWAKATETEEGNGLLHDEIARQIISNIDYDFTKFKHGKLSQIGCCIRANLIDEEARNFLDKHHRWGGRQDDLAAVTGYCGHLCGYGGQGIRHPQGRGSLVVCDARGRLPAGLPADQYPLVPRSLALRVP